MPDTGFVAVTGASRGIGRSTAEMLAARGYRVFALARSLPDLQQLASLYVTVTPIEMDIAGDTSRQAAVDRIMELTDGYGLDVLVNNAGYGQMGALEEVSLPELREQFEVNFFGLLAFTQPFLPGMRSRRHGRIVNVSSAAGLNSTPFMGAYSASKFALEAASDALRRELAPWNVQVVLIEPGPIRTNFGGASRPARDRKPASPYAPLQRRFKGARSVGDRIWSRSAPDVANVIVQAIEADKPQIRYSVTPTAKLAVAARRFVPEAVVDWVFARALGRTSR